MGVDHLRERENHDCRACSLFAILTELPWLHGHITNVLFLHHTNVILLMIQNIRTE